MKLITIRPRIGGRGIQTRVFPKRESGANGNRLKTNTLCSCVVGTFEAVLKVRFDELKHPIELAPHRAFVEPSVLVPHVLVEEFLHAAIKVLIALRVGEEPKRELLALPALDVGR